MPGLRLSYWNPRLLRTVFHQLQQQQQTGLFCDVTLQGDGEANIHVHSCVIAACSPYLANLLSEISKNSDPRTPTFSNRHVLRIHGIKSLHLLPLVNYMYTSELEVAPGDVSDVLKAAQKLQIPELELLKLEGGRLVRSEPGRRLNRNCLSSKTHAHYTKSEKPANAKHQGIINSGTNVEIKPILNSQNKIENDVISVSLLDVKQSNENMLDVGTSSCGMPDIRPGNQGFSDVLCSGKSIKDFANSDGYLENMPSRYDLLPYAPSNQNTQGNSTPCSDFIKDCENSKNLGEDSLNRQDFVQDVISNQDSPTDARNLDLTEYKLKGSFDNAPNCQDLSEQRINIYGLLDNVQFSQDSLDNEQSIGGLAEDVQSLKELPEHVQIKGGLLDDIKDVGKWPEGVQSIKELPKVGQSICNLPEEMQSTEELPENMPNSEGLIETGARGEDIHLNLLNRCKQNKNNPEVFPDQERKCSVKPVQSRYFTKSRKGFLKRIRLNRKREEIAFVDTKLLKFKNSEMDCNNIDISGSDTFGIVDNKGLTSSTHCESDTSEMGNSEGLILNSHCEPEVNAPVDHEDLKSSACHESKQNITALLEDFPFITHCESDTSEMGNSEGLILNSHCEPEVNAPVDHEDLKSSACHESKQNITALLEDLPFITHCESKGSEMGNSEGLILNSHCEPEVNAPVDHEDLKSSTCYESKQSRTALLEDLPSITHCKSKTSETVDLEGLTLSIDYASKQSGSVDNKGSPSSTQCEPETSVVYASNKCIADSRKRQYNLDNSFENNLKKVKLRKSNDGLSWEVVKGVESINIAHSSQEKEHLKKHEKQVQQIINVTTHISPYLDVGVYSPPMSSEECVWPDLSSESDMEIDVLG
ncbi:BTB/POZ domain-containing protein 18 [Hyla sarda]|uniref:BTB/POZ domain-containing protein 18 n=1 Tax=Hyla sarda TaxID=327740 RepID=UPI0024C277E0|nr:BTB/POZ domain-containing protein 18 [Hyla sarda]XP_056387167.1 BTB/POZ domain-containing protein 18 [Hyla sarda]XP_056387169.1 BTB/POZ domain-containing protein 18 [Hyla sarda]XP_056387170.1 BTB/POZ domain-containing protein 18 [Hyla sarda]XP_056387171.1 BTB/POZ domain-containing protein 18 [Hyla sarda]XP_056387172.1 BTB/POZ domain-containing protein 18 [Hyla sarda]XP_056387173.1 BTB/POZ domain-containing protein 18 [Hyla sarda]